MRVWASDELQPASLHSAIASLGGRGCSLAPSGIRASSIGIMVETRLEELKRDQNKTQAIVNGLVDRLEAVTVQMRELQEQNNKIWEGVHLQLMAIGNATQERIDGGHDRGQSSLRTGDSSFRSTTEMKPTKEDRGNPFPKLEFPDFDGTNLEDWVYKSKRYFDLEPTAEIKKVRLASIYLYGKALRWHYAYIRNRGRTDMPVWAEYIEALTRQFGKAEKNISETDVANNIRVNDAIIEDKEETIDHIEVGDDELIAAEVGNVSDVAYPGAEEIKEMENACGTEDGHKKKITNAGDDMDVEAVGIDALEDKDMSVEDETQATKETKVTEDTNMAENELEKIKQQERNALSNKIGWRSSRGGRISIRKKLEEDVCSICCDGGELVLCDHRGCPKVYHHSYVNRDEASFQTKGHWNGRWHLCSSCGKNAIIYVVRRSNGFCDICRVRMIGSVAWEYMQDIHSIGGLVLFLNYLKNWHANIRAKAADVVSENVRFQRKALSLIQYLLRENEGDCDIVSELGFPRIMMHLADCEDSGVREAALRGLLELTQDKADDTSDRLAEDEEKLKQLLEERSRNISSMTPDELGAAKEERQLVDSICDHQRNPVDFDDKTFKHQAVKSTKYVTISMVIVAAEFLKRADDLVRNKILLTSIISGYRLAMKEACKYVEEKLAIKVDKLGKECLVNCAKTSMSSQLSASDSDFCATTRFRKRKKGRLLRPHRDGGGDPEGNFDRRLVYDVLRELVCIIRLVHLDRFPDCLECLISIVVEIPGNVSDFGFCGSEGAYREMTELCRQILREVLTFENNGVEKNSVATEVLKLLSGSILGEYDARAFSLGFLGECVEELGSERGGIRRAVVNLSKYLAQKVPEKSELRAEGVESIMEVVKTLGDHERVEFFDYVLRLLQVKNNLRILAVDLIMDFFLNFRDLLGIVLDGGGEITWGVKFKRALIQRCSDSGALIRARALSNLEQLVGIVAENGRSHVALNEVLGIGDGSGESLEDGINDVLRKRCMDEKALVRSVAINLVNKLTTQLRVSLDGVVRKTIGMACSDPLVSIRKAAASALSEKFLDAHLRTSVFKRGWT